MSDMESRPFEEEIWGEGLGPEAETGKKDRNEAGGRRLPIEQRLRLVLEYIKDEAGFESFPQFLQQLFDKTARYKDPKVLHTLSSFLSGSSGKHKQPSDIVQAMYDHYLSQVSKLYDKADLSNVMPSYSCPPNSHKCMF